MRILVLWAEMVYNSIGNMKRHGNKKLRHDVINAFFGSHGRVCCPIIFKSTWQEDIIGPLNIIGHKASRLDVKTQLDTVAVLHRRVPLIARRLG